MRKFWKTNLGLSLCLMLCVCLVGIAPAQDDGAAEKAAVESAKKTAGDEESAAVESAKKTAGDEESAAVESAKKTAGDAESAAVESAKETAGDEESAAAESAKETAGDEESAAAESAKETAGDAESAAAESAKETAGDAESAAAESAKETADDTEKAVAEDAKDKEVASVNGVAITSEELEREVANIRHKMSRRMPGVPVPEDLEDKALDNIINRRLLLEESRKAGITVENSEIEAIWQQTVARFPSEEAVKEILKKENVTEEMIRGDIRNGLTLQKYVESEFTAKADVSEEEIKEYYDKNSSRFKQPEMVKASHILIKVEDKADEAKKAEARKKIEEVEKLVKEGKDFAELAKEYSEGPSNVKGGDLGFFGRGQMVKPFSDAAFALKPGEVSPIVETRFGFHIIKVFEKKEEGLVPLEEAGPKIREVLSTEKTQEMVNNKLESLKAVAKIERYGEPGSQSSTQ